MDTEPVALLLRFAFLAGLFLFLFWIAASGFRTLRATNRYVGEGGFANPSAAVAPPPAGAWLVTLGGGGLKPGSRFDAFGGLTIGRSPGADVRLTDRFASSMHARIVSGGDGYYLEDMASTNGTYLNGVRVSGTVPIEHGDIVRIGEAELQFELEGQR